MPKRLKDLDIHILSLVDKAANKRSLILKNSSSSPNDSEIDRTVVIRKVDDEKRIAYSIVYPVNQSDAHGEYADAETVEKACWHFMKKSKTGNVDKQHDLVVDQDCYVAENWIVRKGDELFPDEADLHAWASGIKVDNDEIWQKIKKGEITGVSMWGFAQRVDDEPEETSKSFFNHVKKFFTNESTSDLVVKDFQERLKRYEVRTVVEAVTSEFYSVINDELDSLSEKKEKLIDTAAQFTAKLGEIEVTKALVESQGSSLSEVSIEKIKKAIQHIDEIERSAFESKTNLEKFKNNKVETQNSNTNTEQEQTKPEEVQKTDAEKIADLEKLVKDQSEKIEKLEKSSGGSAQEIDTDDGGTKTEVKKTFPWLGS